MFFGKTSFQLICATKMLANSNWRVEIFFEINGSRNILTFGGFTFPRFALHNEVINKTQATNDQENSAHCFESKYLIKHLVK